MNRRIILLLAAAVAPAGIASPDRPCGSFSFVGSVNDQSGEDAALKFEFNPVACRNQCNATIIGYIQLIREFDTVTGQLMAYSSEHRRRIANRHGWAVDRHERDQWGYYGRLDNGVGHENEFHFTTKMKPGSNTGKAQLTDSTVLLPNRLFQALDIPVCMEAGQNCISSMLGAYFWSTKTAANGEVILGPDNIAGSWAKGAAAAAVENWNNSAGKIDFPSELSWM